MRRQPKKLQQGGGAEDGYPSIIYLYEKKRYTPRGGIVYLVDSALRCKDSHFRCNIQSFSELSRQ